MELRDYLRILRKGWPLVLAFVVLGAAIGIGITLMTKKVYESSVTVFVAATQTADSASDLSQGNSFTESRVQSYTDIATSPKVTEPVIGKLKLSLTPQQLADKISADAPLNKVLVNLHVTDHDPQLAARLAAAVGDAFITAVEATDRTATGQPAVYLTVIHPAAVPDGPIKPNKLLDIGLGLIVGLLVGIGVVVLRDVLDNTVKGPQDFEQLGIPVLGLVPFDKRTAKTPVAFRGDPHSARSEAYRQLRTNLQFVNVDNTPKLIAITSGVPSEGKTTTAINLAAALAESGSRVCLVEADLRRPTISKVLGLVPDVGFTTVLIGRAPLEAVLQNAGRNLAVLTSGPVPPNPSELLVSEQTRRVLAEIARNVDFVVVDTAPLLPVADGAEIASICDATLVVHHAGKSTKDQALRSVEALAKVDQRPVGVVLNMMTKSRGSYDYGYGYYYTYRPDRSRAARRHAEADRPSPPPLTLDAPAGAGDDAMPDSGSGYGRGSVNGGGAARASGGSAAHAARDADEPVAEYWPGERA